MPQKIVHPPQKNNGPSLITVQIVYCKQLHSNCFCFTLNTQYTGFVKTAPRIRHVVWCTVEGSVKSIRKGTAVKETEAMQVGPDDSFEGAQQTTPLHKRLFQERLSHKSVKAYATLSRGTLLAKNFGRFHIRTKKVSENKTLRKIYSTVKYNTSK